MTVTDPDIEAAGAGLLRTSTKVLTVGHAVLSIIAVAYEGVIRGVIGVVFVIAFGLGIVTCMAAFFKAAGRSRHEQVTVVGAFFLGDGAVPRSDQRLMIGAVFVQTIVALVAAGARPVSAVAFSVLVPLLGLGLAAQLGARYGTFEPQKM